MNDCSLRAAAPIAGTRLAPTDPVLREWNWPGAAEDEVMNDNKTNTYNLRQRNVNTTDKGNKDTLKNPSEDDMDNVEDNTRIGI